MPLDDDSVSVEPVTTTLAVAAEDRGVGVLERHRRARGARAREVRARGQHRPSTEYDPPQLLQSARVDKRPSLKVSV